MKLAEEFVRVLGCGMSHESKLRTVRQIQADALRYAANLSGEERDAFLLALADKLDPQKPHPKP